MTKVTYIHSTPDAKKQLKNPINGTILVNGIDRIDSRLGYSSNNCQSCCEICNKAKRDLTPSQFNFWINKLVAYRVKCNGQ